MKKRNTRASTPVHMRVLQRTKIPTNKKDCWLWCGPVNNAGYGMIKGDNEYGDPKMMTVHRAVARANGLDIDNHEIQHTCLVKHCVNPRHLVHGTPQSRSERIIKKHGRTFCKPKVARRVCEHCGIDTHVVWFNRVHKDCYPGMSDSKNKLLKRINTKQLEV
jgi:hypothetical protein